jgi:hypothetical protein
MHASCLKFHRTNIHISQQTPYRLLADSLAPNFLSGLGYCWHSLKKVVGLVDWALLNYVYVAHFGQANYSLGLLGFEHIRLRLGSLGLGTKAAFGLQKKWAATQGQ